MKIYLNTNLFSVQHNNRIFLKWIGGLSKARSYITCGHGTHDLSNAESKLWQVPPSLKDYSRRNLEAIDAQDVSHLDNNGVQIPHKHSMDNNFFLVNLNKDRIMKEYFIYYKKKIIVLCFVFLFIA